MLIKIISGFALYNILDIIRRELFLLIIFTKSMIIILLGSQASGKGTQGELLSKRLKLPTLSIGQLYRDQISKQTQIGKMVKKYVIKGELAPEEYTEKLLTLELKKSKYKKGVIFDGFPRNFEQVKFIEKLFNIDVAILIDIDRKEVIKRIIGRLVCQCGEIYNLFSEKSELPLAGNICKKCKGKLKPRSDDSPKAIKERLRIYDQETKPIINYFQQHNKLIKINGDQHINDVFKNIMAKLEERHLLK